MKNIIFLFLTLNLTSCAAIDSKFTEKELFAAVLVGEATGEKRIGMEAVWEVINNRAKQRGMSKFDVVIQTKQFSCLNNTTPAALIAKSKKDKNYNLALQIINNPVTKHVGAANHYYSVVIKPPRWINNNKFVCQIGKHRFYRL